MMQSPVQRTMRTLACAAMLTLASTAAADEPKVFSDALVTLIELAEVPARAIGPLAEITVREGDVIKQDALLAKIDDAEAVLAAERAAIERDSARREAKNELPILAATKAAEAARAELKRAVESAAKYEKSISQTELDRLKLTADEAEYKQRQAVHERGTAELTARVKENELATIQHRLELHQIKSPIAGVVVEVKRRRGEWVEPGTPVARIMLLDRLRVETFCYSKDLQTVQVDRPVRLRVAGDGAAGIGGAAVEYEGRITFVSPEVNPVNGQVRIWAEVNNADRALRPGMSGSLIVAPTAKTAAVDSQSR